MAASSSAPVVVIVEGDVFMEGGCGLAVVTTLILPRGESLLKYFLPLATIGTAYGTPAAPLRPRRRPDRQTSAARRAVHFDKVAR
jgi:enoyl-CoA hydratase/carnithine racemase